MDMRQIEFFVAVAEELNFTRAAEMSHVSQSGLSASIRSLERELRHQLFDRSPRAVTLTAAGHAFLPRARSILADSRAAVRELARADDEAAGSLALGSEQCLGDLIDLPDVLAAFRARHPAVDVRAEQLGSRLVLERVRRGDLDAGLVAGPAGRLSGDGGIDVVEIARDRFELLLPPGHPLTTEEITWSALEGSAFVDFGEDWTARALVDDAFRERRLPRRTAITADDVHMLLDLVRRGAGPALVPASYAAKPQADGLVRRSVPDPGPTWAVHLVTGAGAGRPARLFADLLLSVDALDTMRTIIDPTAPPRTRSTTGSGRS
ncbi:LysR family transcriptional regulator [Streptomyces sp. NPDC026672]|uniref:LysR family transcriptional regulator n=1 Tax=unclassified Streptomyces TaxID=2593676 RepID=UPI0033EDDB89